VGSDAVLDEMVTSMRPMRVTARLGALGAVAAAALAWAAPAFAQIDISGTWANRLHEDWIERAPGPEIGDYTGLPLNDEGRARADAYQVSLQTMPERQCILYTAQYMVMGPQNLKIVPETDPISGRVVAWRFSGTVDRAPHTIWMDGRPHPSKYAPHTAGGFSTGEWQGNMLVAYTTHLTEDMVWRNGVPASDQATMTETYVRHDNTLTITMILDDPVYFEEPFIRSASFVLDPSVRVLPEPCEPQVEITRKEGDVPHYLPGGNPFLKEVSDAYRIPLAAVRGGAATMYPEYRKALKDLYVAPAMCTRNCCAGVGGGVADRNQNCVTEKPAAATPKR
jgi:hypothetical protein